MKYLITRILKENQTASLAAWNAAFNAARNASWNAAFNAARASARAASRAAWDAAWVAAFLVFHKTQNSTLTQKAADIYGSMSTYLSKGT